MNKLFLLAASAAFMVLCGGCRGVYGEINNVVPGVDNRAGSVSVTASCVNHSYPKTYFLEPSAGFAGSPYRNEVLAYVNNSLKYLGMIPVARKDAGLLVTVDCVKKDKWFRRMGIELKVTAATAAGAKCWEVLSSYSAFRGPEESYLPGLAGGLIPWIGREGSSSVDFADEPRLVNAAMGN